MFKYEEFLPIQRNELHWNRYVKFIGMCRKTAPKKKIKGDGYEAHHIIMRAYTPKNLWKDLENIIFLTPRQHYIAHLILWKTFEDKPTIDSFHFMVHCKKYPDNSLTARQYECLKLENAKVQSEKVSGKNNPMYGKTHSSEARKRISESKIGKTPWNKGKSFMSGENHPLYGTHRPDSVKNAISKANTGRSAWSKGKKLPQFSGENHPRYGVHCTEETKNKIRNRLKGRKHVIKDNIIKSVPPEELDFYLRERWELVNKSKKDSLTMQGEGKVPKKKDE